MEVQHELEKMRLSNMADANLRQLREENEAAYYQLQSRMQQETYTLQQRNSTLQSTCNALASDINSLRAQLRNRSSQSESRGTSALILVVI